MFRLHGNMSIDATVESIWQRLIDFPAIPTWEDGVLEVRQVSPGSPGLGTELVARRVYAGRESTVTCRITEWDPGHAATMSIEGGPIRNASVRYAVEPSSDGVALVSYSAEGQFRGGWRLLTPLAGAMGRSQVRSNLARLKAQVEASAAGPSPG
jgi:carbon monoxide dehydrogenase subunit G